MLSPMFFAFTVSVILHFPHEVSGASDGGGVRVLISWLRTHLRLLTAAAKLEEHAVRFGDLAYHESAIMSKKTPFFPPFVSLLHCVVGKDS